MIPWASKWTAALALCLASGATAAAQPHSDQPDSRSTSEPAAREPATVDLLLRDVTRVSSWSFFAPTGAHDAATYSTLANRATLGIAVRSRRIDAFGAFQYSQMVGLPERTEGADALGPGGEYFAAAGMPQSYQLYFKALSVRLKAPAGGWSIEGGRMVDADSDRVQVVHDRRDELRLERIDDRLIGRVEWSTFERAFDGVRLAVERTGWRAGASLVFPTQGVFEESASPTMEKLRVVTASFTWNTPAACDEPRFDWQLFVLGYKDRRDVTARPDNSLRVATSADLALVTLGASHAGVWPVRRGRFETVVWSAWQTGDWYEQRHRAASALIEGGYQWTEMAGRPRARAGWLHASGDESPSDQWHRTFFPLLPATRPEVMEGTFAQMNARQLFASLRLSPHPRVNLSAEVRRLRLASGSDLWYSGSGATEREGRYFGFSGRLASGETALGTMLQGRADVAVHPRWRVSGAFAIVRGGAAVRRSFERHRLMVFTVESAFSLR